MLKLIGRKNEKQVEIETGQTILDHALKTNVDWGFSCIRGTCARCRTLVIEGMDLLNEPTEEEEDRLDEDELKEGYRLGCQAVLRKKGTIVAQNKSYF